MTVYHNAHSAPVTHARNFENVKNKYRHRWHSLLFEYGLPEAFLTCKHGPCPICGGKDRFRFDNRDGDGTYLCNQCGSGDGLKLLSKLTGRTYRELIPELEHGSATRVSVLSQNGLSAEPQWRRQAESIHRYIHETWCNAEEISHGDPVDLYLRNRGLVDLLYPNSLRCHENLRYYEDGKLTGTFPAMIGKIENPAGEMIGLHQTYLSPAGTKANVTRPKKWRTTYEGAAKGAAIRLLPATHQLVVGEGVETCLALLVALAMPVWCALSASGIQNIVIPSDVEELVIGCDHDLPTAMHPIGHSQECAVKLAERETARGRRCKIIIPPKPGTDWLDVLNDEVA